MRRIIVLLLIAVLVVAGRADASGKKVQNEYWPNGKVRLEEIDDSMGDVLKKNYYYQNGALELAEGYDALGNKILEANYDQDGQLKENSDGWAVIRWKYNGDNMVAEGYYGTDKKLQEVKLYDEEGDLVDKKYYGDKNILPSEEYNPEPTLAGESDQYYDQYGKLEGTTSVEPYDDFFPLFWDMDDMLDEDHFRR